MADTPTPAAAPAKKGFSLFKPIAGMFAVVASGVVGVYSTAFINNVAKPPKPVANFAVHADGLVVTCQNHASGDSGWWDFGDGTPLEAFDANTGTISHNYTKPGSFNVKLTVRNFVMEENERSVPVELQKTVAATGGPSIPSFTVEPIGGATVAPATFRVRGEIKNAERIIWDLGGDKLEVNDVNGVFEKLVVFERPGTFPIQLIGQSDTTAVKQAATVTVQAPRTGSLTVSVRTIDTGIKVERQDVSEMVALPLPAKGAKSTTFEKVVQARRGFTIADAKIAKPSPAVKSINVVIADDKRSAKITGEFIGVGDAATKAAGGSDAMISVQFAQEKSTPMTIPGNLIAMPFLDQGGAIVPVGTPLPMTAMVPMPPAPVGMANMTRKIEFQIKEFSAGGAMTVIGAVPDLKLPLRASVQSLEGKKYTVDVQQMKDGSLRVVLQ